MSDTRFFLSFSVLSSLELRPIIATDDFPSLQNPSLSKWPESLVGAIMASSLAAISPMFRGSVGFLVANSTESDNSPEKTEMASNGCSLLD